MSPFDCTIQTDRLSLMLITPADAVDVFAYGQDAEVARYTSWPAHRTVANPMDFVDRAVRKQSFPPAKLHMSLAIRLVDQPAVVGTVGIIQDDAETAHCDYCLARPHWNRGLMTEAVIAVTRWGFEHVLTLQRITSGCLAINTGSRRVLEKSGYRLDRTELVRFGPKFDNQSLETTHYVLGRP